MSVQYNEIDLENEKIIKIINAALAEFAKFGMEKASLNKILKASKISKGVFYHYFNDKEELFNYLLKFTIELSLRDIDQNLDWDDDDIIKRICEVSKLKLLIIKDYPYMIEFGDKFKSALYENADKVYMADWRTKFYTHNVNFNRLRDEGNAKEVLHIVRWTYKGIFMGVLENDKMIDKKIDEETISELIKKCDTYYQVLVSNFYK